MNIRLHGDRMGKGMMGKKMPERGHKEVTGLRFKPAENGLMSEMSHRTFRGGQGGGPDYDHGSTDTIHPSMHHAMQHLKKNMGHVFGNPMPEAETDSAPEGGKMPADTEPAGDAD